MEGKKISFGFMKTKKVQKPVTNEKKEYVECMEEKAIKVVGGEQVQEAAPLVIPLKPNTLVTSERLKQIAEEVESAMTESETQDKVKDPEPCKLPENETLDQMAIRELLQDVKKEIKTEPAEITVPVPSKPVLEGQKESTLADYEDVPVQEFGMAMLRGMGWTPNKDGSKYKQPLLRPKGLGLGADKVVTENQKKKTDKEEELSIVKNSYVKITTGKYGGCYAKVLSLDEDNGRVMVDITMKKETVSLSEFMMQPVTKAEFDKESKVINADSFEEYKRNENTSHKVSKNDNLKPNRDREASTSTKDNNGNQKDGKSFKRGFDERVDEKSRDRHRRNSSSTEERSRPKHKSKKKKKRYSSSDSFSSLSDDDKARKHKSSKTRCSSASDSDSDSPRRERRKKEKKRDIDKKRKGKKKKRDRDRSPNYKKHRK